jgi:predicted HicB family RNase H-like nuclease
VSTKFELLIVRLAPELKTAVEKTAKRREITISEYVRERLADSLRKAS